jgi:hypothetical protein
VVAEVKIDLTDFTAAVEAAVEERDKETGNLAVVLFSPVGAAFRALEGIKAKNAAKHLLNESMRDAMNSLDMPKARAYMLLSDSLTAAAASVARERVPADPTEAFVQRVVGLRLASTLAVSHIPAGVKDDWQEKANALLAESDPIAGTYYSWLHNEAEDKGDEPDATTVVKAAVKLASGKSAKVGSTPKAPGALFDGPRRDIGKHIAEAFANEGEGTFLTIAQIRAFVSEEYGENPPSAGAISARLFPTSGKCTLTGVRPEVNEKNNKGAVKAS